MALLSGGASSAILHAQLRTLRNLYPRQGVLGVVIGSVLTILWYGLWTVLAFVTARALAEPGVLESLPLLLPNGLLLVFLYWQLVPLLLVSSGLSLDGRKLLVYPIPAGRLFAIEALLRLSSSYGLPAWLSGITNWTSFPWMPWGATAELILAKPSATAALTLPLWLLGAYLFARWQFQPALVFDAGAQRARERATAPSAWGRLVEAFYQLPSRVFADPLGVLVEKELRFLSRAPRFRLVFLMGFSFGIVLWLPMAFGKIGTTPVRGVMEANFFTVICVYALTLLGEVALWNNLGFDRSAAQMYFLAPLDWTTVLLAKNIAGLIFLVAEVGVIGVVMLLMQMPLGPARMLDALLVTLIFAIYLFAVGNLGSIHYPRPMDPAQSWRANTGSRFQFMLLIVYPLAALPILLAYGARHIANSEWLFYGVLVLDTVLAVVVYRLALYWAVNAAETRREQIITTLTAGSGPIA